MTKTIQLYRRILKSLEGPLQKLVHHRMKKGKEDPERIGERYGMAARPRPAGGLVWVHAASVGEAQSALILIDRLLERLPDCHVLVTSGTITSAALMQKKLPDRAFHQYYPLDHPDWVRRFMDFWRPDLVLWMESELWPNMLLEIRARSIPAVLVNARLSDRSFRRWGLFAASIRYLLGAFSMIMTQTARDSVRFQALGAHSVLVTDNLKYSARALPCPEDALKRLSSKLLGRKVWVYASTHAGEEALACRLHQILKHRYPDILTILVPRHPERREEVRAVCDAHGLHSALRTEKQLLPDHDIDIYIADTLGELGLFYRLCPLACIGRSFSDDGGGGHNPLEAAQLHCVVLHGPHVQNLRDIYDDMDQAEASFNIRDEEHFLNMLRDLFDDPARLHALQAKAQSYARSKTGVIDTVMEALEPVVQKIESGISTHAA